MLRTQTTLALLFWNGTLPVCYAMVGGFSVAAGEVFIISSPFVGEGKYFTKQTFQPFTLSTVQPPSLFTFRPILSFSVILRRTSRWWKASAIPVYCECEKPKDLLKNFTVILRLSRRIPLKRHEILRAPPSEWHVRGAMGFFGRFTPSEWHDLDKMGHSLSHLCQN